MRLSAAAAYFDDVPVLDAYSGVQACMGQVDPGEGVVRDALTVSRRVLSVVPGVTLPARGALRLLDTAFLVSALPESDYFRGAAIRDNYVMHRADGLAEIKTILQELTNVAGTSAYAAMVWVKGSKEVDESSLVTNQLNVYLSSTESVAEGQIVKLLGKWFAVREVYNTPAGFLAAVADQLDAPNFETVSYAARVYVPATDNYTSTPTSVKALRLRWQSRFEYLGQASAKYQAGDDVVMVAAAAVAQPTTGDTITLSDGLRRVEAFYADGGMWHLHVRRV